MSKWLMFAGVLAIGLFAMAGHSTSLVTVKNTVGGNLTSICGQAVESNEAPADNGGTISICYGDIVNGVGKSFMYEDFNGNMLAEFTDVVQTHVPTRTAGGNYYQFSFDNGVGTSRQNCVWAKYSCYFHDGVSTFPM